jgi:hypothetical protein
VPFPLQQCNHQRKIRLHREKNGRDAIKATNAPPRGVPRPPGKLNRKTTPRYLNSPHKPDHTQVGKLQNLWVSYPRGDQLNRTPGFFYLGWGWQPRDVIAPIRSVPFAPSLLPTSVLDIKDRACSPCQLNRKLGGPPNHPLVGFSWSRQTLILPKNDSR